MKFYVNNPAFLQMGGNKPMAHITRFVLTENSGGQVQLSANGSVVVEYMQDGEIVRDTYSALSDTYVPIPAGIEATIYGSVTVINNDEVDNLFSSLDVSKNQALTSLNCRVCTGLTSLDLSENPALTFLNCSSCTGLTSLDLSKNTALTDLYCNDCTGLTSLDFSKNPALTDLNCSSCMGLTSLDISKNAALIYLYCNECTGLTSINGIAINNEVSTTIATAITNATSVDGTVTLRQGDEFNQTIIDAAMEKGWDVQYAD